MLIGGTRRRYSTTSKLHERAFGFSHQSDQDVDCKGLSRSLALTKAASYISFQTAVREVLDAEKTTGKDSAKTSQARKPSLPKPEPPQTPTFQAPHGNLAATCLELGNNSSSSDV
jgi:hypothetical protein